MLWLETEINFALNCGAEPDPKAVICVKCGYELKPFSLPIQERPAIPPKGYDFGSAIRAGFNNYAIFQGRSTRTEFWYWTLFILIVNGLLLCGLISGSALRMKRKLEFWSSLFPI